MTKTLSKIIKMFFINFVVYLLYIGAVKTDNFSTSLLENLLRDYDKIVRPVENPDDYLKLYLGIRLSQIADIDERNQIMTTNVWIRHVIFFIFLLSFFF